VPSGPRKKAIKNRKGSCFSPISLHDNPKGAFTGETQDLRLKIDPGSKFTGIALANVQGEVFFASEITHRGQQIKASLDTRRSVRRSRRNRHTRYRKPRFDNRTRPIGWLPPSLMSRVHNVMTWVNRLCRIAPVSMLSMELACFDLQKRENPEISGVEYQGGTLFGFEIKGYLLHKWGHQCAYCKRKDIPLQIEHVIPKARGGTNRASNLAISCKLCNQRKGTRTAIEFGYPEVQKYAKAPQRDAAVINATRWNTFWPAGKNFSTVETDPAVGRSTTGPNNICQRHTGLMQRASENLDNQLSFQTTCGHSLNR